SDIVLALVSLAELLHQQSAAATAAAASADPASPWALTDGWRLNQDQQQVLCFCRNAGDDAASEQATVIVHYRAAGWELEIGGHRRSLLGSRLADGRLAIRLDDAAVTATVLRQGAGFEVFHGGERHTLQRQDSLASSAATEEHGGSLAAPMPGKVIAVMVQPGAKVARGAPLLILEAMKMEHTICAPADGVVSVVYFQAGEQVTEGSELIAITPADAGAAAP
ncbi:MAG: biotin/lipoyl-containing protein, partial [Hyphomicrobium sp.]|nr:biotin/lipoyl-containing protein [Hyphomicrobium sp.]